MLAFAKSIPISLIRRYVPRSTSTSKKHELSKLGTGTSTFLADIRRGDLLKVSKSPSPPSPSRSGSRRSWMRRTPCGPSDASHSSSSTPSFSPPSSRCSGMENEIRWGGSWPTDTIGDLVKRRASGGASLKPERYSRPRVFRCSHKGAIKPRGVVELRMTERRLVRVPSMRNRSRVLNVTKEFHRRYVERSRPKWSEYRTCCRTSERAEFPEYLLAQGA